MSKRTREIVARQKRRKMISGIKRGFIKGLTAGAVAYGIGCGIGCLTVEAEETTVPKEIRVYAEVIGKAYNICPELLEAMAFCESSYDVDAKNGTCVGLMQVSEKWHGDRMEELGVTDLTDGYSNMLVAADYLSELFEKYEDVGAVLMVYNGDSDAFDFMNGKAPISDYADDILALSAELERQHGK